MIFIIIFLKKKKKNKHIIIISEKKNSQKGVLPACLYVVYFNILLYVKIVQRILIRVYLYTVSLSVSNITATQVRYFILKPTLYA